MLLTGCETVNNLRDQLSERFSGDSSGNAPAALEQGTTPGTSEPQSQAVKVEPPSLLMQIEQRLSELGYDPGPVDGRLTARTEAAIQDFQLDNGLKIDGRATKSLLQSLQSANKKGS
ncbi:MAG: peptidoglycan-binding domain-containing protein [Burkholderiaceae bacterium]